MCRGGVFFQRSNKWHKQLAYSLWQNTTTSFLWNKSREDRAHRLMQISSHFLCISARKKWRIKFVLLSLTTQKISCSSPSVKMYNITCRQIFCMLWCFKRKRKPSSFVVSNQPKKVGKSVQRDIVLFCLYSP